MTTGITVRGLSPGSERFIRQACSACAQVTRAAVQRAYLAITNTGIVARLSVAFVLVAILAVTANLLAEHGVAIIQTRTIERPLLPTQRDASRSSRSEAVSQRVRLDTEGLLAATGRFDRAVARRAISGTADDIAQMQAAGVELQAEAERFFALAGEPDTSQPELARLRELISRYRKQGEDLVSATDRRRRLFSEYWEEFERLDAQVKGSLDRNWKIFGRVIARQSLIAVSRDLDTLRRDSARLTPAGAFDKATLDAIRGSEERLAIALEENARSLGRSQGEQWLAGLRAEFGQMVSTRTVLVLTDEHATHANAVFTGSAAQIDALLRAENLAASDTATSVAVRAPSARGPAVSVAEATEPPASFTAATTVPNGNRAQVALAVVSGAILILLLLICVATVRSVVVPIRRFVATIVRLSAGDADARVERGGIRELDTLAVSFNEMAAALANARAQMREYQSQLEERVDERTRQYQHLAEHDPLTGLPNRRQLLRYLHATLRSAALEQRQVGVFFLDLDNFKNINDSMGHAFGDRVLQAIAQRLREATQSGGFAARLGGDEFTVVHDRADSVEHVCRIGGQLVCAFQKPIIVDSRELLIGISVGASVYPDHECDGDALLRAADAALFQAKTGGRSQLSLFSPAMLEAATLKFRIEQGLRRAVDRGEFELLFQPEVSFETMDTKLVEALLRWRLPDGSNVAPGEFLAVAEESGLIMSISDWVLSSAIESAGRWYHGAWPGVRMAINVSARQLLDSRFVERVSELMQQHDVPATCLEVELTETVLQTGPATIETLRRLRELGISIALDDFGTGYSSLASLEKLPLTRLKLDRSLIASIHTSARSLAITRAIVGLCQSLGLTVTAEGIETPEQLVALLEFPSLCLQGYLIAQPAAGDSLPSVVREMPRRMQSLLLSLPVPARRRSEDNEAVDALRGRA